MVASGAADVIEAMEGFLLTERAARALHEALSGHVDPADCGRCTGCGDHLDRDLRCQGCGQVGGIFGATVAHAVTGLAQHHGN